MTTTPVTNQTRDRNGRFTEMNLSEPVRMGDTRTGSFEYPPVPESVDDLVAFWQDVYVPDGILDNVRVGYARLRAAERDLAIRDFEDRNPMPSFERSRQAWRERRDAHVAAAMADWPDEIPQSQAAAGILRVTQMVRSARRLSPGDRRVVSEMMVKLPGWKPAPAHRIVAKFRTDRLTRFFTDPERANLRFLAENTPVHEDD